MLICFLVTTGGMEGMESCKVDTDCHILFGATCQDGMCMCKKDYVADGDVCLKKGTVYQI